MTKYVISSGFSVLTKIPKDSQVDYSISTVVENGIKFDTAGEAMLEACKINNILGHAVYRIMSIEI